MLQIKDNIETMKASGAQAVRCYVLCGFHPTVDDEAAPGQHIEVQPRAQGPFMICSTHLDFTHPNTQSDAACARTALVMVSDRCIENMGNIAACVHPTDLVGQEQLLSLRP